MVTNHKVSWDDNNTKQHIIPVLSKFIRYQIAANSSGNIVDGDVKLEDKSMTKYGMQLFGAFCQHENREEVVINDYTQTVPNEIFKVMFLGSESTDFEQEASTSIPSLFPTTRLFPEMKLVIFDGLKMDFLARNCSDYFKSFLDEIQSASDMKPVEGSNGVNQLNEVKYRCTEQLSGSNKPDPKIRKCVRLLSGRFTALQWRIHYSFQRQINGCGLHEISMTNYNAYDQVGQNLQSEDTVGQDTQTETAAGGTLKKWVDHTLLLQMAREICNEYENIDKKSVSVLLERMQQVRMSGKVFSACSAAEFAAKLVTDDDNDEDGKLSELAMKLHGDLRRYQLKTHEMMHIVNKLCMSRWELASNPNVRRYLESWFMENEMDEAKFAAVYGESSNSEQLEKDILSFSGLPDDDENVPQLKVAIRRVFDELTKHTKSNALATEMKQMQQELVEHDDDDDKTEAVDAVFTLHALYAAIGNVTLRYLYQDAYGDDNKFDELRVMMKNRGTVSLFPVGVICDSKWHKIDMPVTANTSYQFAMFAQTQRVSNVVTVETTEIQQLTKAEQEEFGEEEEEEDEDKEEEMKAAEEERDRREEEAERQRKETEVILEKARQRIKMAQEQQARRVAELAQFNEKQKKKVAELTATNANLQRRLRANEERISELSELQKKQEEEEEEKKQQAKQVAAFGFNRDTNNMKMTQYDNHFHSITFGGVVPCADYKKYRIKFKINRMDSYFFIGFGETNESIHDNGMMGGAAKNKATTTGIAVGNDNHFYLYDKDHSGDRIDLLDGSWPGWFTGYGERNSYNAFVMEFDFQRNSFSLFYKEDKKLFEITENVPKTSVIPIFSLFRKDDEIEAVECAME